MDRNWREFTFHAIKSIKHAIIACALVPVFFFLMNPPSTSPEYFRDFWKSMRIGVQIAIFSWFALTVIYAFVYASSPATLLKLKKTVVYQIPIGLAVMVMGIALSALAEPSISGDTWGYKSTAISALMGGSILVIAMLVSGYRAVATDNLKLQAASAEANLNVLKNQMQPHFLFNSLNSLSELIEVDKNTAAGMAQKLSELYREILENSKQNLSTVESELSIIRKYLDLEKVRFGERLEYEITAPREADRILIPSLVLQTLVENAVKHGIGQSIAGGRILVAIEPQAQGYVVEVVNVSAESESLAFAEGSSVASRSNVMGTGTGLDNTKSRLQLLYGDRAQFGIRTTDRETKASFWISGSGVG